MLRLRCGKSSGAAALHRPCSRQPLQLGLEEAAHGCSMASWVPNTVQPGQRHAWQAAAVAANGGLDRQQQAHVLSSKVCGSCRSLGAAQFSAAVGMQLRQQRSSSNAAAALATFETASSRTSSQRPAVAAAVPNDSSAGALSSRCHSAYGRQLSCCTAPGSVGPLSAGPAGACSSTARGGTYALVLVDQPFPCGCRCRQLFAGNNSNPCACCSFLLQGKIKSLEQIYLFSLAVKEYQIVDFFLGGSLKDEVRPD